MDTEASSSEGNTLAGDGLVAKGGELTKDTTECQGTDGDWHEVTKTNQKFGLFGSNKNTKIIALLVFLLMGSNAAWTIAYLKTQRKNMTSHKAPFDHSSHGMTPSKDFDSSGSFRNYVEGLNDNGQEDVVDEAEGDDGAQRRMARKTNSFYCDQNNVCEILSSVYTMSWSNRNPPCGTYQDWADFLVYTEMFPVAQLYTDMVENYIFGEGFGAKCFPFLESLEFTSLNESSDVCRRSNEVAIYRVGWELQVRTACVVYVPTSWGGSPSYVKTMSQVYETQSENSFNRAMGIVNSMGW